MSACKDFTTSVNASFELLSGFLDMVTVAFLFIILYFIANKSQSPIQMVTSTCSMHITNSTCNSNSNFSSPVIFPFITLLYEIFFLSFTNFSTFNLSVCTCFLPSLCVHCWLFNVTNQGAKSASVEEKENLSQQNFIYALEKTWSILSVSP